MKPQTDQAAILTMAQTSNAMQPRDCGRLVEAWSVVGQIAGDAPAELVTARCWMGLSRRASVVKAAVWVRGAPNSGHSYSGSGQAGGYGYHKTSAAIGAALDSAGIRLAIPIGGCGDSAVEEALRAIAIALGADEASIVLCRH